MCELCLHLFVCSCLIHGLYFMVRRTNDNWDGYVFLFYDVGYHPERKMVRILPTRIIWYPMVIDPRRVLYWVTFGSCNFRHKTGNLCNLYLKGCSNNNSLCGSYLYFSYFKKRRKNNSQNWFLHRLIFNQPRRSI